MQKEMSAAAEAGFRFGAVMGGDTSFGGSEVVIIMTKPAGSNPRSSCRSDRPWLSAGPSAENACANPDVPATVAVRGSSSANSR